MKIKENIFEELNKMKNLMVAKAGTVISEQAVDGYDIATIQSELDKVNSDEQKIVNIIKKYKDKASFKNLVDQYKSKTGKDFGVDIYRAIQPYNDKTEWNDLKTHLAAIGVTLGNIIDNKTRINSATFSGLDTPAAGTRTPESMKTITSTFCGVKNGKITAGAFKDQPWTNYKTKYSVTDAEEQEAKKSCPTVQSGTPSGQRTGQSVNDRFSKSAESLGVKGGKMDLQTLQSILKTLEGGESAAAAPASQGSPDIAQLTAALNQLQA